MSQAIGNVCHSEIYGLPLTDTSLISQTALAYARVWHHADASERVLGKLAERIAIVLMGKHKPIFDPSGMYLDTVSTHPYRS